MENLGPIRVAEVLHRAMGNQPTWVGPNKDALAAVHALRNIPGWLCVNPDGTLNENGQAVGAALRALIQPILMR